MKNAKVGNISLKSVSFSYGNGNEKREIFENLNIDIKPGEFVSIIGPSGCGKSTLIKLIGGLLTESSGSIGVDDKSNIEARTSQMFSFVFQKPILLPWRSVKKNIELPVELMGNDNKNKVLELLKMVGLEDSEDLYPHQLSGGMQQRVAIARALSYNPKILLMDEPFSAVDELTRKTLNKELLRIWEQTGVTILFVTHSISEAMMLSDKVIVLSKAPATIKKIYTVPFSRPRDVDAVESNDFKEDLRCLREMLE
jgi:NitT/TauT family transport system ATP-binding protein